MDEQHGTTWSENFEKVVDMYNPDLFLVPQMNGCLEFTHLIDTVFDGYESFQTTNLVLRDVYGGSDESLNVNHLKRRRRSATDSIQPVHLHIHSHDQEFKIWLNQSRSVIHPAASIHFRSGNIVEEFDQEIPDCFLTGSLVSHDLSGAVFSYCSQLMGTFSHDRHTYRVETIDNDPTSNETTVLNYALVARRAITSKAHTCATDMAGFVETVGEMQSKRRYKRQVEILPATIEIAVVADALMTASMRAYGASDAELIQMMAFKWTLVRTGL